MTELIANKFQNFLAAYGWADKPMSFLAGDCSNRKYYRLGVESSGFVILMDAPPPEEKLEDFVRFSKLLAEMGLSTPEVIQSDLEHGFALIEDFGDTTYSKMLKDPEEQEKLYTLATKTLIYLHKNFDPAKHSGLPHFTFDLFLKELSVMRDWYYPEVYGKKMEDKIWKDFVSIWSELLTPLSAPETLVLRDFMVDNMVYLKNRTGIGACGLLDFQDAVLGRRAYDLVSLLEDARYDVPSEIQSKMKGLYMDAFPELDRKQFLEEYSVLGAQRSIKILGIFMRMFLKHGKDNYLKHIPRVWRWINQDLSHPRLEAVRNWMDQHMPELKRRA